MRKLTKSPRFIRHVCALLFSTVVFSPGLRAQNGRDGLDDLKNQAPRVFIDCRRCDKDYIRTEITFVNFVRDKEECDIHVLITDQRTGADGREYTMTFMGRNEYSHIEHTLVYISQKTDTRDETRLGMVNTLRKGLFPYMVENPLMEHFSLNFYSDIEPTAVEDPWDFWVFSLSLRGSMEEEASQSESSFRGNISINRITPEWKLRLGFSGEVETDRFVVDDEEIKSSSDEKNFTGIIVKSLGKNWSVGGWFEANSSAYDNRRLELIFAPAVEFNVYPYSESTRRQLRFLYRLGYISVKYREETIYDKIYEDLLGQSFSATLEVKEPWGNVTTSLEGSHFFHDFSKNRVQLWGHISFRIFKGLSMNLHGRFERIRDQLSLAKGEASLDEILLQRKELATDYEYSISTGLSYTFGSVFSNVVNPRFGR